MNPRNGKANEITFLIDLFTETTLWYYNVCKTFELSIL